MAADDAGQLGTGAMPGRGDMSDLSLPVEIRDWSGLPADVLSLVFAKVGATEALMGVGLVCHSWLQAAKVPDLWRCVDMAHHEVLMLKGSDVICAMAKVAVDRCAGRLEVFEGKWFINDELLKYIGDRSPSLKGLSLVSLYRVTGKGFAEFLRKCPLLEDLVLNNREIVSRFDLGSGMPLGIATLHQLRRLTLEGISISNEELTTVLDGCLHLELLDVSKCFKLDVDDALIAKCSRIKTLKLPASYSYGDPDRSYKDYIAYMGC